MKLNRESLYGLQALVYLAQLPEKTVVTVREIAEACQLPESFLAKVLRRLVQQGIVASFRGKKRGYALTRASETVSVKEILEAIEGPALFERCVFWGRNCGDDAPCPLHEYWKQSRALLVGELQAATLEAMAKQWGEATQENCGAP